MATRKKKAEVKTEVTEVKAEVTEVTEVKPEAPRQKEPVVGMHANQIAPKRN